MACVGNAAQGDDAKHVVALLPSAGRHNGFGKAENHKRPRGRIFEKKIEADLTRKLSHIGRTGGTFPLNQDPPFSLVCESNNVQSIANSVLLFNAGYHRHHRIRSQRK